MDEAELPRGEAVFLRGYAVDHRFGSAAFQDSLLVEGYIQSLAQRNLKLEHLSGKKFVIDVFSEEVVH